MSSDVQRFVEFFEAQRSEQAVRFGGLETGPVLTYTATTSRPGALAQVSAHRLRGVEPGPSAAELRIRLAGPLPQRPRAGELVAVHLTSPERHAGYQAKTLAQAGDERAPLLEEAGDELLVKGSHLYTVHLGPYVLKFFEQVPFDEVQALCGELRHALCAVGENANLSPRFVFHHEVRDGRLTLFHGEGLALKTWMNLQRNPLETRLVLDLDDARGYLLRGLVEPFGEAQHPEAWAKVRAGFAAGGWGEPSRCLKLTVDALEPLVPVG